MAVDVVKGIKFIAATTCASSGNAWPAVERRFLELTASANNLLPSSLFGECIGMNKESKEFASELFRALARRHNIDGDLIGMAQLKIFWEQISSECFYSRLQTLFDMMDRNADGRITEEEVAEIISVSASANKLCNVQKQSKEYAALITEELDPDNVGHIMMSNLETILLVARNKSENVTTDIGALSKVLSQELRPTQENNPLRRWNKRAKHLLMNNWQRVWVMSLWICLVCGLFAYKFIEFRRNKAAFDVMGCCICVAKGGAETLKFNMALILHLVCRNTVTWLRNKSRLGSVVPFDDNIKFHKTIAIGIVTGVGLHAISHLTCNIPRIAHATQEQYEPMKECFGEEKPPSYVWFIKDVEGVTGIIMLTIMAVVFTMATASFR